MNQSEGTAAKGVGRELHLTRVFDAPRALVFKAWTDPEMVAQWWGPRMFDTPVCEVDARSGGLITIHMRGPDGKIYPMKGIFTEVTEPERLVFTGYALMKVDGDPVLETRNTVTLSETGGKTTLTVDVVVVMATAEAEFPLAGMEQGWNEQLDRLGEHVAAQAGRPRRTGQGRYGMDGRHSPAARFRPNLLEKKVKGEDRNSPKIRPFLWFNHEAEDAAQFYISIFKNSRIVKVVRYGEAGKEIHHGTPGSVMTVDFELEGQRFAAINGGPAFKFNESISFVVDCANQAEVDHYWSKLGDGGDESAQACGWLKDRYGISWQIVPRALIEMLSDEDAEKAARVTNVMLKMKKLDVAELKRAYDGRD